ncbi:MAG: hypothetical protein V7L21_02010 [Nostoc sp.]|uniref:hypothetical protein n=1 Tax=unclassified Nostoc TaxID=2593658 RepID=UPI002FFBDBF5
MVSFETKAGVEAVTKTALTYQLLSQYPLLWLSAMTCGLNQEANNLCKCQWKCLKQLVTKEYLAVFHLVVLRLK